MVPVAQCPVCGQVKPTSDFYPNSTAKRGHALKCKVCWSAHAAVRYQEYRETGSRSRYYAEACAQRKIDRLNNRLRVYWYLFVLIHYGELGRALEAKAETKRRAAVERARAWMDANPERVKEGVTRRRETNRGAYRAWGRNYTTQKSKAMPPWADREAIKRIYVLARNLELWTGEPWHVDHVVPLQHPLVCGLHCPANLQPVTKSFNLQKSNRFWPDMPEVISA